MISVQQVKPFVQPCAFSDVVAVFVNVYAGFCESDADVVGHAGKRDRMTRGGNEGDVSRSDGVDTPCNTTNLRRSNVAIGRERRLVRDHVRSGARVNDERAVAKLTTTCEKTGGETSDMVLRVGGVGRFPVPESLLAVERPVVFLLAEATGSWRRMLRPRRALHDTVRRTEAGKTLGTGGAWRRRGEKGRLIAGDAR
ncbi:BQ5605_C003g02518 [Microbotryum silenes-dioicae]|uniref:BQ5605_C003g02518 protein n=1 Tax=Microbotryum silenes-dioicae TaxID=796604 RepID=A0A2X0M1S1_9BASI|nr:BQ5605_C003g02518 [Microbotryum silenes-dioicae]